MFFSSVQVQRHSGATFLQPQLSLRCLGGILLRVVAVNVLKFTCRQCIVFERRIRGTKHREVLESQKCACRADGPSAVFTSCSAYGSGGQTITGYPGIAVAHHLCTSYSENFLSVDVPGGALPSERVLTLMGHDPPARMGPVDHAHSCVRGQRPLLCSGAPLILAKLMTASL